MRRIKPVKLLFFIAAIIASTTVTGHAQDKEIPKSLYTAANIADSLKDEANSVLRYSMEDVLVKGPGRSTDKIHTVVAVLNEKANGQAGISLPYNRKFNTVSSFEMIIYDANGKQIKKYHKSDMYEHAAVDDESLITDDRVLSIGHDIASYPTTIEMIIELENNSLINIDNWHIQGTKQSVENSYYHLSIASNAGLRYQSKNTTVKPQKSTTENMDSYLWQVHNLKAIKPEDGAYGWTYLPRIDFMANKFEYYGLAGDISSWQNYGKWQQGLNQDIGTLSPQRVEEIKKMTAGLSSDKEKAKFLYKYMQQNMRYVYVQLGIGGLKPFPATFVDEKKYGDCKALSNYMVALLKAVNINAYYAKVRAGTNEEACNPAFPSDLSNHIIVCVPFKNDTTWLECTSSTQPFGVLGPFTENRNALIISEDGGKLVNTPKSKPDENQFNAETHIVLDADGGAKASVKIAGTGEFRALYLSLPSVKVDRQKEFLMKNMHIKQPSAFDLADGPDGNDTKEINLNLDYDKFCDVMAGNKIFYRPSAFLLWDGTLDATEKRKTDFYFEYPLQKSSVTTIDLPAGFDVETLPANQSLKFTFGSYDVKYSYNIAKNQITSVAKFNLNNHVIPAAKYAEMQQYLDAVAKAQNKKLVIKRKA